jgi:proline dehydrogenase
MNWARRMSSAAWSLWEKVAVKAGRSYVAGPALEDAIRAVTRLESGGYRTTLCYWNVDTEDPAAILHQYRDSVRAIAALPHKTYLSIKPPALRCQPNLHAALFQTARQRHVRLHFDAHGPETADTAFGLIESGRKMGMSIGCTLPGRWSRSVADAAWAVERELPVRVVKGQWPDPKQDRDFALGFLDVIDRLAGSSCVVRVATHDPNLGREALRRLSASHTACSLELLFGLPWRKSVAMARSLGVPVRFYVPYGHGWLPYCLTQIRQHPKMLTWVLRDTLRGSGMPVPAGEPTIAGPEIRP